MDDSLQRWCIESLTLAQDRWSALRRRHRAKPDPPSSDAEQTVERAAFVTMLKVRGVSLDHAMTDSATSITSPNDFEQSLVRTCPLDERSPVEALGLIHEYLISRRGNTRKPTSNGRSTSRKTNGIFYTPPTVIDYIVGQTLCRRLESLNLEQVEGLKVLDPAVGCGAFLVRAYHDLAKWQLQWFIANEPAHWPMDVEQIDRDWRLTFSRRASIVRNCLFGVDLDPGAIHAARRTLWLALLDPSNGFTRPDLSSIDWMELTSNLRQGHALTGPGFGEVVTEDIFPAKTNLFAWTDQFPQVAIQGGFDVILGNPPYRRERDFKQELDDIALTPLGRHRSPRMDLWYYFVHRGIQLLREGGTLSFITNAYWLNGKGAEKLIAALRDNVHLDELFLLKDQPIFPGVAGQHQILRLTKSRSDTPTRIKTLSKTKGKSAEPLSLETGPITAFEKVREKLFRDGRIDVRPSADQFLDRLGTFPRLIELGVVRQGIAENPSTINRRTIERFRDEPTAQDWLQGEGVFSLTADELAKLALDRSELALVRPYHDLCDLKRYWSATTPSRRLIYSTRLTCPEINDYPAIRQHLVRFQKILDARRETQSGNNRWWHLHWPRDERIWRADKLVVLQLAARPSVVPRFEPTYVSFSANVFVPDVHTREDLRYLCALLNSRLLWAWFEHHAKHRGIGLELNGHVLEQAPVRRIDFCNSEEVKCHDNLVTLVTLRMNLERTHLEGMSYEPEIANEISDTESQIDGMVASLYGLQPSEIELINANTGEDNL